MHEIMRQSIEFDFVYGDAIAQRFDFAYRTYAMKLWQRKSRNDYLGEMDRIERGYNYEEIFIVYGPSAFGMDRNSY